LAEATADTITEGQQETLSVNLDLHKAAAGTYFLATAHEQDQAAYYCPLQIKQCAGSSDLAKNSMNY
jgi:hypothetical protein